MNAKKAGIVYAASFAGAGMVAYLRGQRERDLWRDALVHGFVAGSGLVAVGYALDLTGTSVPLLSNPSDQAGMGKMPAKAVELLRQVDAPRLFSAMKNRGVKVAPVPKDPGVVEQDEE